MMKLVNSFMPIPLSSDLMLLSRSNQTHVNYDRSLEHKISVLFSSHFSESAQASVTICNQLLTIHFGSSQLAQKYMPALQHLSTQADEDTKHSFTLYVVDVASVSQQSFSSFLTNFFNKQVTAAAQKPATGHFLAFDNFAYYYNTATHWGVWFVYQHEHYSPWHFANPFRYFLYDWLVQKQYQLVHASGISNGQSALLFAGTSGSAKSTTALMALKEGYSLLGDDHCAVSFNAVPRAFSLPGYAVD